MVRLPVSNAGGESFANVRLTTERLTLREIEEDDWRSLLEYWSHPEVARYMPRGALDEERVKGLVQRAVLERRSHPRRYFRLAVVLKEGHQFVGDCVCRLVDPIIWRICLGSSGRLTSDTISVENSGGTVMLRRLRQPFSLTGSRHWVCRGYGRGATLRMWRLSVSWRRLE